jgi:hypothetical protein
LVETWLGTIGMISEEVRQFRIVGENEAAGAAVAAVVAVE